MALEEQTSARRSEEDVEQKSALFIRRCPQCKSTDVRRSFSPKWADKIMIFLIRRPYRCHHCGLRYYGFAFSARERSRIGNR